MTSASPPPPAACPSCDGAGWKYLTVRRSALAVAGAPEADAARRRRVECADCGGTGAAAGTGGAG
ncbi:MAG: hypothetical protein ACLQDY_26650 [Streptosporangiaceae bacterium]